MCAGPLASMGVAPVGLAAAAQPRVTNYLGEQPGSRKRAAGRPASVLPKQAALAPASRLAPPVRPPAAHLTVLTSIPKLGGTTASTGGAAKPNRHHSAVIPRLSRLDLVMADALVIKFCWRMMKTITRMLHLMQWMQGRDVSLMYGSIAHGMTGAIQLANE